MAHCPLCGSVLCPRRKTGVCATLNRPYAKGPEQPERDRMVKRPAVKK